MFVVGLCCIVSVLLAMNDVRLIVDAHSAAMSFCKPHGRSDDNSIVCICCVVVCMHVCVCFEYRTGGQH